MFVVYILQSESTGKYYVGHTANISDRLQRHNSNREKSTKIKGPWKIIRKENYKLRSEAIKREKIIKSYKGGNEFKKLLWQNRKSTT